MAKTETEELTFGNPFRDSTYRFEIDALLRKHGFRIRHRKQGEEPIWERGGEEFRQRDALRTIPNAEIAEAKKRQEKYYGQDRR